jgi:hypothetical protein
MSVPEMALKMPLPGCLPFRQFAVETKIHQFENCRAHPQLGARLGWKTIFERSFERSREH